MVFSSLVSLQDRFFEVRATVVKMYPTRQHPGKTYAGFIGQLVGHSARLLELVTETLRQRVIRNAGAACQRRAAPGLSGVAAGVHT